ncbi:MAG: type IX secretion system plug protein domain-containing protein, partial [Maribacter dokdonensis]
MRIFFQHFICLLFLQNLIAQVQVEVNPPENIKSIVFKGPTEDQFPVIKIGEPLYLEFDDILANEQDYYYKIVHCDYDWTPSSLLKSQFLDGVDNQRITDYENSYSTLQSYSNYQLTIPNDNVRLKVSGNYLLEVYNSYNEIQFSRRFVVYKDVVTVGTEIKRSRDFNFINEKQVVQFSINSGSTRLTNPKKEVK